MMKYRRMGNSGIRISSLGLGTMFYGGAQFQATDNPVSKDDATKVIHKALEHDINYLDCADIYGAYGTAEQIIGAALAGYDRETVFLASKVMMPMSPNEFDRGLNRKHIVKSIDRTLANFDTSYIDLYYAHRYDPYTPLNEVIKIMNTLIEEGKIRYWGTSNWSGAELERTQAYCLHHGLEGPIVDQTKYNFYRRHPVEIALPYTLDEYNMGLVPYKILAEGIFASRFSDSRLDELDDGDKRVIQSQLPPGRNLSQEVLDQLGSFVNLAKSLDITPAQLTYAWVLRLNNVSSALMSTRHPERIEENLACLEINLEADTLRQLNELFPPEYQEFNTYSRVKQAPGPDIIGKITEEMMRF